MSDSPFIPFYPSDWLAGTRGLTAAETGVYITLVAMMYEANGPIAADLKRLGRLCGTTPAAFEKIIDGLLATRKLARTSDGCLYSEMIPRWAAFFRKGLIRPAVPASVQREVLAEGVCSYCGNESGPFEIDHIIPWSRGGSHDRRNLTLACVPCNRSKGSLTAEEWMQ